jgi:hypothetical protein
MAQEAEVLPGGQILRDQLASIRDHMADVGPPFATIIESFHEIEQRIFDENGPGWPPLADATMAMTGAWERLNRNADEILIDTGATLSALKGGPGFRLHASGAGWPPQRQFVKVTPEDLTTWCAIIAGWLFFGEAEMQTV